MHHSDAADKTDYQCRGTDVNCRQVEFQIEEGLYNSLNYVHFDESGYEECTLVVRPLHKVYIYVQICKPT